MNYTLYSLVKGREGRHRGECPAASVSVNEEGQIAIDCSNRELKEQLENYFAEPLQRRVPIGAERNIFAYAWQEVSPGGEGYLEEAMARLHRLNLAAVKEEEAGK